MVGSDDHIPGAWLVLKSAGYLATSRHCTPWGACHVRAQWIDYISLTTLACPVVLQGGDTPLLVASSAGHHEAVQALLDKGADVNLANKVGCLHNAHMSKNRDSCTS